MNPATCRRAGKAAFPAGFALVLLVLPSLLTSKAQAGPSAEIAKRCLRYAYIAFPYKRPGSVPMSGDRQAYFQECMARDGNVPRPSPPNPNN